MPRHSGTRNLYAVRRFATGARRGERARAGCGLGEAFWESIARSAQRADALPDGQKGILGEPARIVMREPLDVETPGGPPHERHEEFSEWIPRGFDPERFDPARVVFRNARKRLNAMLEEDELS